MVSDSLEVHATSDCPLIKEAKEARQRELDRQDAAKKNKSNIFQRTITKKAKASEIETTPPEKESDGTPKGNN